MIGRLTGIIVEEQADGTVVLDVQGVGYEVLVPLGTVGRLRANHPQGPITLHIHTHVREDIFQLFGFASADDRSTFRVLLSVSSIGPKTAISILSALPASELASVIARKELARLVAINGIGKRTAERLLLELRDKLTATATEGRSALPYVPSAPTAPGTPRAVILSALTNLGYKMAEAERAVDALGDKIRTDAVPDLIRESLAFLRKS